MQFLKTLFWVVLAVLAAILASANWRDVTLSLWGNLEVDIKLPLLLLVMFLLGWLPTWAIMRGRLWQIRRQLEPARPVPPPPPAPPADEDDRF